MCQIVPLSPLSLVTRPTAMMPPLPSGIAWRTTGRPAVPEAVRASESASWDHKLSGGALHMDVPTGPVRKTTKRSLVFTTGPKTSSLVTSVIIGVTPMITDVTKDDVLGPVVNTKDRFVVFLTGPVGTSIWSAPPDSLWSQEADWDALTASGTTGRPVVLQAIADGQGGIIAVGRVTNDKGDNGIIWHMSKPGDWHQAQILDDAPPEISSVAAGPNGFVASSDVAGGSPILYSTDGETWQAGAISVASGFP